MLFLDEPTLGLEWESKHYRCLPSTGCLTLKGDFWTHDPYDLDDNYFQILDVHFDPETWDNHLILFKIQKLVYIAWK